MWTRFVMKQEFYYHTHIKLEKNENGLKTAFVELELEILKWRCRNRWFKWTGFVVKQEI